MYKRNTVMHGALCSATVIETNDVTPKRDKKSLDRLAIQDEVFDTQDSIADNAKMISLIFSTLSRMYDLISETNKNKLNTQDRAVMEYTFAKFKDTPTRADIQIQTEGIAMIDRLLDRQKHIGTILER